MRFSLLLALCASTFFPLSVRGDSPFNEEEGLSLRRIADFWQEGEYQIAKNQMEEFLSQFPESPYAETLCMALGDLFLREKNYPLALEYYGKVGPGEMSDQVFLNRMHCLYHLQWHATLADECEACLQRKEPLAPDLQLQATYLLSIALYQQCLNSAKEPEILEKLANRAKPYFEILSKSELSSDVAEAHAHLCCLVKDFEGASSIYLNLAKQNPESEELLFQAALLQSKHDKEAALETFRSIAAQQGPHAKEAAYNELILHFEQGRFAFITESKEAILQAIPAEREGIVHLIFGKSFLALKEYKKASEELNAFLNKASPDDSIRPALLHLMEAAYQSDDLSLLDQSIDRLRALDEQDVELPKALFSRAQILKKEQNLPAAQEQLTQLLSSFSQFADRPQASFELAHLASSNQDWDHCRIHSLSFLKEFPTHELAPFAWRYFVSSSTELANSEKLPSMEKKKQLASDLEKMLRESAFLTPAERSDWTFLLAKTHYETHDFTRAVSLLEPLVKQEAPFAQKANGELLLGLAYRDGQKEEAKFTFWAEQAIAHQQTLLPLAQLHISLFNSYLARPDSLDLAAEHLRLAFESGLEIQLSNLLWLADYAYGRSEKDAAYRPTAAHLLSQFVERTNLKPSAIRADSLYLETLFVKLAKLYSQIGERKEAIIRFESLASAYATHPELAWNDEKEVRLLLGEAYLAEKEFEKAETQFEIVESTSPTKRNPFSAKATLQNARLKLAKVDKPSLTIDEIAPIAAKLKDLVIQKVLENEPTHLEAGLDYIELQTKLDPSLEKKLSLLQRMKADFESQEDLLAKDYHAARAKSPAKNELYLAYMQYLEATILLTEAQLATDLEQQKELQAKGKGLLLQLESKNLEGPLLERMQR